LISRIRVRKLDWKIQRRKSQPHLREVVANCLTEKGAARRGTTRPIPTLGDDSETRQHLRFADHTRGHCERSHRD
jgi:hypothetical protein